MGRLRLVEGPAVTAHTNHCTYEKLHTGSTAHWKHCTLEPPRTVNCRVVAADMSALCGRLRARGDAHVFKNARGDLFCVKFVQGHLAAIGPHFGHKLRLADKVFHSRGQSFGIA